MAGGAAASSGSRTTTRPAASVGEPVDDVVDQVALGVDHHRTPPSGHVAEDEVRDERRFARPGGAQDVEMLAGIGHRQTHPPPVADFGPPEHLARCADLGRRSHGVGTGPGQPGHASVGGQVGQGGQFRHRQQVATTEASGSTASAPPGAAGGG